MQRQLHTPANILHLFYFFRWKWINYENKSSERKYRNKSSKSVVCFRFCHRSHKLVFEWINWNRMMCMVGFHRKNRIIQVIKWDSPRNFHITSKWASSPVCTTFMVYQYKNRFLWIETKKKKIISVQKEYPKI